jgi:hypothetical protein
VEIRPDRPNMPPGLSLLGALGRLVGQRDIRVPTLAVLALLALLVVRRAEAEQRPLVLGLTTVLGPLALGTALGLPVAWPLAALVGAWLLAGQSRARAWVAGLLAGLAVAFDHRALLVAPLLLVSLAGQPRAWRRALAGAASAYGVLVLPVAVLDLPAFGASLFRLPVPGPSLGIFNLFIYWGVEDALVPRALAALSPAMAAMVTVALLRWRVAPLVSAGLATLAWIVLAPALSPNAVAVPILLLGLSAAGLEGPDPVVPGPSDPK